MMEIAHSARLEIPPGARSGERHQIDLRSAGIENLLLDVTIVRALVVPATMRLLGRANWWAPGPLARFGMRLEPAGATMKG